MFVTVFDWIPLLKSESWYLLGLEKSKPCSLQILLLPDSLVLFSETWMTLDGRLLTVPRASCPLLRVLCVFFLSRLRPSFFWPEFLLADSVSLFPSIEFLLSVPSTIPELKFGSFLYFPRFFQKVSSSCSQWPLKHCYFKGPAQYLPFLDSLSLFLLRFF